MGLRRKRLVWIRNGWFGFFLFSGVESFGDIGRCGCVSGVYCSWRFLCGSSCIYW